MQAPVPLTPASEPRLYGLVFCYRAAGLTKKTFIDLCDTKQIPVRLYRLSGPRGLIRVDAADFSRWMGDRMPFPSLF